MIIDGFCHEKYIEVSEPCGFNDTELCLSRLIIQSAVSWYLFLSSSLLMFMIFDINVDNETTKKWI